MKTLYKATISPTSSFITPLKGDTIFGQMCWAVRFKYGKEKLENLLSDYEKNPFLIVSDGFVSGYLPKPNMPSDLLKEKTEDKKQNRKKIWLRLDELQKGKFSHAKTDKEVGNFEKKEPIIRNALNYKTFHTGDGFDPYSLEETSLGKKDIYLLSDERLKKDELKELLEFVGLYGYGKKATIGKGRFEVDSFEQIVLPKSSKRFMALCAFSPEGLECKNIYYNTFVRFGKTGSQRATTNAFKKPLILADCKAVVEFEEKKELSYIGKAIKNISTYKDIVHQGYSIVVAIGE